ncbi:hypothetical protein ACH5RR_036893 [Cinchona calisaya]|uniref:Uncharacterized protein n=1 Tax=Cinchona calisaya TaxID=153742 RepID=A0ABD2Y8Z4_9GENT
MVRDRPLDMTAQAEARKLVAKKKAEETRRRKCDTTKEASSSGGTSLPAHGVGKKLQLTFPRIDESPNKDLPKRQVLTQSYPPHLATSILKLPSSSKDGGENSKDKYIHNGRF